MTNKIEDRLVREILRALDGKLGATYPQMLARRIIGLESFDKDDKFRAVHEDEKNWLGRELLRLVQTGDTEKLRQVADASEHLRKNRKVFNLKRYERLRAYFKVYEREGRPPKIRELIDVSGDDEKRALNEKWALNNERAIRKLLRDLDLPYTSVPTGHPKGVTNSRNPERLRRFRSLMLR